MHHASCIMHQKCFQPPPSFRKMMKKNQIHTKQHAHAKVTPAEAYSCLQVCVFWKPWLQASALGADWLTLNIKFSCPL